MPVNDIGLYAKRCVAGCGASRVWAGGGLGAQPFLAKPVADFVPADDVLVWCEAIVRVQHRHGERKNRSRARMKYVVKKMGLEKFRELVEERGARASMPSAAQSCGRRCATTSRGIRPRDCQLLRRPPSLRSPASTRGGAPTCARSGRTATGRSWCSCRWATSRRSRCAPSPTSSGSHGDGTLRCTNDQNLVLPSIPEAALPAVHAAAGAPSAWATPDAGTINDVVSCPGMDYCSLAITRSMGVAERVRAHLLDDPSSGEGFAARLGRFT